MVVYVYTHKVSQICPVVHHISFPLALKWEPSNTSYYYYHYLYLLFVVGYGIHHNMKTINNFHHVSQLII